jgi:PAS domain S-box-containing protein
VLLQVRDVSEREATEENLRLQSAALKSTANAIVITDASGRIVWVNPAFTTLTGYTAEEAAGQNPRVLKSGRQPPEFYDAMWRTVLAGEVWRGELINRRKDGSLYTEDMTITPVRDEAGQITHFIAVKQDATERNRMSEELRNSNLRLRQALDELQRTQQRVIQQERLGALGQMASGIAHDFNNTLMPILGYSELLLHVSANLDDPQKVRRYLGVIRTCAEDASRIVSRLREFHRPREATEAFTHVDLNRLVAEALTLTQPKWKNQTEAAGIAIRVLQDLGSVPQCDGNASDLREVLTNLIFNAVDAMPQGGTLTLRTRAENAHLIVEVSDTGVGMSKSVRQHCFEPFYSTKGEHGTGLGLAMVYGIVQRHDGTIDIQTELNRGTTFRIRLPLAHSRPESSAAPSASNTVRALRVLFADDEPNVRDILVEFMTADGHAVTAVSNGEDALTQLRDGQFDLAIVDRAMPSMSGDQLAAAMKSIRPHVPIIMLTGFGGLMHAAHEQPAAVDFVVSKPITLQQLREALATAAASSQARQ